MYFKDYLICFICSILVFFFFVGFTQNILLSSILFLVVYFILRFLISFINKFNANAKVNLIKNAQKKYDSDNTDDINNFYN